VASAFIGWLLNPGKMPAFKNMQSLLFVLLTLIFASMLGFTGEISTKQLAYIPDKPVIDNDYFHVLKNATTAPSESGPGRRAGSDRAALNGL